MNLSVLYFRFWYFPCSKSGLNSCVHYFSTKSCVHICHARDKNIETITVGFTVLKKYMSRFSMVLITSWTTELRHFRSTSGFIGCWKFLFQKFWLHQKIRREISGGVFRAIFDLRPHLVIDIVNFEPFVTRVTDMDATVNYN